MPDLSAMVAEISSAGTPSSNGDTPQTYNTPEDAYNNHPAIKDLVQQQRDDWAKGREMVTRAAYRNILFYRGHQWVKWDRAINRYRPARLKPNTPMPVTNVFASTMDAIISVFARIEPTLNFRPGSPDEKDDRAAADVAIRAVGVVEDEVNIRLHRQLLAVWVALTSMAWIETGYDPDPIHGMTTIPIEDAQGQPVLDQFGQPQTEDVPVGRMFADIVPIFELFFDPNIPLWCKQRACLREKSVNVKDSKARWPHIADQITANVTEGEAGWYRDSLVTMGPQLDENSSGRPVAVSRPQNTQVTEQWYWQMPDATYPDGLLAVIVGKHHVAYAGPLPYASVDSDGKRTPFIPFVCFLQKLVPGSAFAKSVADDLAPKQAQRNRWESILEACGMRMGTPVWLNPNGANVTNLTGDPGNIIRYNAVGPNAAKPERIQGNGIPVSMIEFIKQIDQSFEELAATFDIVKGQRPEGISAGIALQILQERNLSRYGPLFILWEQSWTEWARQSLEIFREFATEPRLMKIKGRDGRWEVKKFLGADLRGRIDVIPEAASSMPRSSLLDRAEMEQLAAMGIVDVHDPEIKFKFLEIYGRTNLTPSMAADAKNAIMEDEAFAQLAKDPRMTQAAPDDINAARTMQYLQLSTFFQQKYQIKLPVVKPAIDDHGIHFREHRATAKSESVSEWPEIVQVLQEKHIEYHQELMVQQAQAMAQPQQIQGGFLGAGPGPKGPRQAPMSSSSSGARMQGDANEMNATVTGGGMPATPEGM